MSEALPQRARSDHAKEDRRAAVAGAALDEFYEKGFAAARMEDIARRAGLSKGAVYLYFQSKEALFEAVVEAYALPNVARLETVIGSAAGAEAAIDALCRLAPQIIRQGQVPKIVKILIGDAPAFPHVADAYRRRVIERALAALTAVLTKSKDAGEIDIPEPAIAARWIVAPFVLSAVWRSAFERTPDAEVDFEALFELHGSMLKRLLIKGTER